MNRTKLIVGVVAGVAGIAAVLGTVAVAQPAKESKPAGTAPGQPELPPGWNTEDMQACMAAGTPGKMHEHLARSVGVWIGRNQMWMAPNTEPVRSECTNTVKSVMEGRYIQCEMAGEMPGMGTFSGLGLTGFDNVSQKFVGSWIDNHSTGIMNGVGELSKDGKVTSWNFTYNCPITKKPAVVRQVETVTGANSTTFEMFTTDPKTGKEYRCMQIDFTRKP